MTDSAAFEAKTKYTKKSFIKFQRFNLFRGGASGKIIVICVAIFFIFGILSVIESFLIDSGTSIFSGWLFILFGIFYLFMPQYATWITFRKNRALFDSGINYDFFDDHFTVTTISDLVNGVNNIRYEGLYKVCETKDCFYFYITRVQSFILSKDSFTIGTPEGLSALLKEKSPPKKFIRYVK